MTQPEVDFAALLAETVTAQADDGYRCWTTDLLTGRPLCHDLPIALDSYQLGVINAPGAASGTVSLLAAEDPKLTCAERRTCLWIEYRGEVVWGGVIWDSEPNDDKTELRIAAQTWSSLMGMSIIRETQSFVGVDQLDAFRSLVTYAQSKSRAGFGITVDSTNSGVLIRRFFGPGAGEGARPDKPVLEAMGELAEVDTGFEWCDDVVDDGASSSPTKRIRLGYPRLGNSTVGDLLFEHPGQIKTYTWPKAGKASPNVLYAVGAGEGAFTLIQTATNTNELDVWGYPRLEASTGGDHKEIVRNSVLLDHAKADLAALGGGQLAPVFTVAGDTGPQPGDYSAGDTIRVRITDNNHRPQADGSPGYAGPLRITRLTVPPERADQGGSVAIQTNVVL